MKLNHRINPRNQLEVQQIAALELAALILEEHLELHSMELTLQAQRQVGWAGADAWHAGSYGSNLIKMNFRNLEGCTTLQVLTVLGHEFRHAVQHKLNWLNYGTWTGPEQEQTTASHLTDGRYASWFKRPQEVDARRFQSAYANIVLADPRFEKFKTALDIEGAVPMKRDVQATWAALGFEEHDPKVQTFRTEKKSDKSYWLHADQVGIKKWTNKGVQLAFKNFKELMLSQPVQYIMVPVTLDDLVS